MINIHWRIAISIMLLSTVGLSLTAKNVPAFGADRTTETQPSTQPTFKYITLPEPKVIENTPGPVIATINGYAIDRKQFNSLLMAVRGPQLISQVESCVWPQIYCDREGIQVNAANIETERNRILEKIGQDHPEAKEQKDREQILNNLLQRQGIRNELEFQLLLQRTVYLRAWGKGKAVPTEEQIQQAWKEDNAEKVEVLDIVIPDFSTGPKLRKYIETEKKSPQEFARSQGYQTNQFTLSKESHVTGDAKVLTDLAFQLRVGEPSPLVPIGGKDRKPVELHFLYCLKQIPATNKPMTQPEHDALKAHLTEALESAWIDRHSQHLVWDIRIDIKDKTLKAYYSRESVDALGNSKVILDNNNQTVNLLEPLIVEDSPQAVIATINDFAIDRQSFERMLMAIAGPALLEQVAACAVAQQACNNAGVKIVQADFDKEMDRNLAKFRKQYPEEKFDDRAAELSTYLHRQGLSILEFQLSLQKTVCLRALAKNNAALAGQNEAARELWMDQCLNKLMKAAQIEIKDKTLTAYYADFKAPVAVQTTTLPKLSN